MKCKRCYKELPQYCADCVEAMLSNAIEKAQKSKKSRMGLIVYEDDPMYKAILARRDIEVRELK